MNLVVLRVDLLDEREYQTLRLPCSINLANPDAWRTPTLNGVYTDRWIANQAHVKLESCGEADSVSIQGFAPSLSATEPAIPVTVGIDGAEQTVRLDRPGQFTISIALPRTFKKGSRHDISVGSPRTFVPVELRLGPDRRRLSVLLNVVEFHNRLVVAPASKAKRAVTNGRPTTASELSRVR